MHPSLSKRQSPFSRFCGVLLLCFAGLGVSHSATRQVLTGPSGSVGFGQNVQFLANGNLVVVESGSGAGAVHLLSRFGTRLASIRGSGSGDQVGSGGIVELPSGDFLVFSPEWANGSMVSAGAVTLVSGNQATDIVVSARNSMVGARVGDRVGMKFLEGTSTMVPSVTVLPNGAFVILSAFWANGSAANAGAATFATVSEFPVGPVSAANSLVGSRSFDAVVFRCTVLANGNYVISMPTWNSPTVIDAGAVVFASGSTGRTGVIDASNALVGSATVDAVGLGGVLPLSTGNYVVLSHQWHNETGAVTFGSGQTGVQGEVSVQNSLVGTQPGDWIGAYGVLTHANGSYLVLSEQWSSGAGPRVGAVTLASGLTGISGAVSPGNSITGSAAYDSVGSVGTGFLPNGNVVILAPGFDFGGIADRGAVLVGIAGQPLAGSLNPDNACLGSWVDGRIGQGLAVLANGDLAILSPSASANGKVNAGAVTIVAGDAQCTGQFSELNSLVGRHAEEHFGQFARALPNGKLVLCDRADDSQALSSPGSCAIVVPSRGMTGAMSDSASLRGVQFGAGLDTSIDLLPSGNFVMRWTAWGSGHYSQEGALVFGDAQQPLLGVVSAANALLGSRQLEHLGQFGILPLVGDSFLVPNPDWQRGGLSNAGAVAFLNGNTGSANSQISLSNALVGSHANDGVGSGPIEVIADGTYVLTHPDWDSDSIVDAGAITLGSAEVPAVGEVSPANSVVNDRTWLSSPMRYSYHVATKRLAVGMQGANQVVVFGTGEATQTMIDTISPQPSNPGEEVHVQVVVERTGAQPLDGHVTVEADTGESCTIAQPSSQIGVFAVFACDLRLDTPGEVQLRAQFAGSHRHGFSQSAGVAHTVRPVDVFGDGFEP